MRRWRTAAWTAAIVAAVGIGAALGPVHGQVPPRARDSGPRVFQFAGGTGSWIGVSVRELADDDVTKAKLPASVGVWVEEVSKESPAETAGIRAGDVIVEYDGERVRGTRQFTRLVQETPAGRKVQASVIRDGQRVPLSVEPREGGGGNFFGELDRLPEMARGWMVPAPPAPPAPPSPRAVPVPPAPPAPPRGNFDFDFGDLLGRVGSGRLGITITELQPQLADFFGTKAGVLVTSVTPDTAAAKAGLKAGDVITAFNGTPVTSTSELRQRSSALKDGEEFSVGVVRDKKPTTLKGKAEVSGARRRVTVL
jgi:serine protease Do